MAGFPSAPLEKVQIVKYTIKKGQIFKYTIKKGQIFKFIPLKKSGFPGISLKITHPKYRYTKKPYYTVYIVVYNGINGVKYLYTVGNPL